MTKLLNLFLVDDDDFFREAMEMLIRGESNLRWAGAARNGLEAIEKLQAMETPDVVLMDIKMPWMNGIECTKMLRREYPDMLIVILTTFNEEEYIIEGLLSGANGFAVKSNDVPKLLTMIQELSEGQYLLPVEVATKLAAYTIEKARQQKEEEALEPSLQAFGLTAREKRLAGLLLKRYSSREMAEKLFLNEGTIRNNLSALYEKLGVGNRYDAIAKLSRPEEQS
ncbi:response regulator transcription factor [Paenibacillus sp. HB172176]|uniref:response regulator transcription factor n=1 Tax=Paenibacillus sp. HB172176 TaxID=2493690 RepID=UPI001438E2B0|nr:response regulator transcription factor [Paenibacillus sp. HB172176]